MRRILIIEDEPDQAATLAAILSGESHAVLVAEDADRAGEILEDEEGQATYVKVNEDLRRLLVHLKRL